MEGEVSFGVLNPFQGYLYALEKWAKTRKVGSRHEYL
jgi:hypothetical protein